MTTPYKRSYSEVLQLRREIDIIYRYLDLNNLEEKYGKSSITPEIKKRIEQFKRRIDHYPKHENLDKEYEDLAMMINIARSFGKKAFGDNFIKDIDNQIQEAIQDEQERNKKTREATEKEDEIKVKVKVNEIKGRSKQQPSPESKKIDEPKLSYEDELLTRINKQIEKIEKQKTLSNKKAKLAVLEANRDCMLGIISVSELERIAKDPKNKGYDKSLFYSETKHLFVETVAFKNKSSKKEQQPEQEKTIIEKAKTYFKR